MEKIWYNQGNSLQKKVANILLWNPCLLLYGSALESVLDFSPSNSILPVLNIMVAEGNIYMLS